VALLFSEARLPPPRSERFDDAVALEPERLDAVLRSLSFVGPALGPRRLAAVLEEARGLAVTHGGATWVREITVSWSRAP
jgi:hypothetical protein